VYIYHICTDVTEARPRYRVCMVVKIEMWVQLSAKYANVGCQWNGVAWNNYRGEIGI